MQSATSTLAMVLPDMLIETRRSFAARCGYKQLRAQSLFHRGRRVFGSGAIVLCRAPTFPDQSAPLQSAAPVWRGYQVVGVIYRGMAYCQPEEGGPKKRDKTTHAAR